MYTFSVVLEFLNICNKYLRSPKAATLSCFRSSSLSIAKTRVTFDFVGMKHLYYLEQQVVQLGTQLHKVYLANFMHV